MSLAGRCLLLAMHSSCYEYESSSHHTVALGYNHYRFQKQDLRIHLLLLLTKVNKRNDAITESTGSMQRRNLRYYR